MNYCSFILFAYFTIFGFPSDMEIFTMFAALPGKLKAGGTAAWLVHRSFVGKEVNLHKYFKAQAHLGPELSCNPSAQLCSFSPFLCFVWLTKFHKFNTNCRIIEVSAGHVCCFSQSAGGISSRAWYFIPAVTRAACIFLSVSFYSVLWTWEYFYRLPLSPEN